MVKLMVLSLSRYVHVTSMTPATSNLHSVALPCGVAEEAAVDVVNGATVTVGAIVEPGSPVGATAAGKKPQQATENGELRGPGVGQSASGEMPVRCGGSWGQPARENVTRKEERGALEIGDWQGT